MILREIQNYVKWSEVDGGYSRLRFIPMLAMVATRRGQDIEASAAVLKDQMAFLAQSQREQLTINDGAHVNDDGNVEMYTRPPPIIYGIIIAQGRLIFVTLYSSNPEAEVKHIGSFNLLERNQEVWNGFAVAILVITVRNYMMTIVDELEEDNDVEDSDPDA
jgi:hypothetical protein